MYVRIYCKYVSQKFTNLRFLQSLLHAAMATQELPDKVDPMVLGGDNGDFTVVIQRLSDALKLNPNNYTLFSNRAAAYMGMGKYGNALADAKKVLELKPNWTKVCVCVCVCVYGRGCGCTRSL